MDCQTLGIVVPSPCPRAPCDDCREGLEERAWILVNGQAFSGCSDQAIVPRQSERSVCKTFEEGMKLAKRQAVEAMPGQRNLLENGT